MKKFNAPEIEVKKFDVEDILTTSSTDVEEPSEEESTTRERTMAEFGVENCGPYYPAN